MPSEVLSLAKRKQLLTWWHEAEYAVEWMASRHSELPVLEAVGDITLWSGEDEDEDEDQGPPTVTAGTISVAKPYLWTGEDALLAMDDISGDYEALASAVLDGQSYSDDFTRWFEAAFNDIPSADPVFVHGLDIEPKYRNPREPLAVFAVLDAAAAFGAPLSPIIGFGPDLVAKKLRGRLRDRGLFDWASALGAQEFRGVLVAPRPAG